MARDMMEALEERAVNLETIRSAAEEIGDHHEVIARANAIVVKDQPSYDTAGEFGKEVRRRIDKVHERFDPICDAAHRTWKTATEARKESLGPLDQIVRIVADKMLSWKRERERKREEAMRKERERLEKIEREKREKEAARIREEAARAAAEAASKREAARIRWQAEEAAKAKIEAPIFTPAVEERAAVKKYETEKVEGISHRVNWDFEIIDATALPREYLMPDEKKIRRVVKAMGMEAIKVIPGIVVFDKGTTSFKV